MVVTVVSRSPSTLICSRFRGLHLPRSMSASCSSSVNFNNKSTKLNDKKKKKLPILLFDVMDTIVRDPFYHHVPSFFRMSFEELINTKHPTAWIQFEKGLIDEMELARNFFKDGRPFDLQGLKDCMQKGYSYLDGIEDLLGSLKQNGYEMHAATNYPIWYKLIEDKLKLSAYLSWTFCSCSTGKRKPDVEFYLEILSHLDIDGESCIFIDDRIQNVDAATKAGLVGLHFKNANLLRQDLSLLGISVNENSKQKDLGELRQ
ncbi:hypothetical protein ACET3Z_005465 [Daucus carota]